MSILAYLRHNRLSEHINSIENEGLNSITFHGHNQAKCPLNPLGMIFPVQILMSKYLIELHIIKLPI